MKKLIAFIMLCLLLLTPTSTLAAEKNSINVLCIGDLRSLDETQYLYSALKECGVDSIVGNLYLESGDLDTHLNNAKTDNGVYQYRKANSAEWKTAEGKGFSQILKEEKWDVVTIQQSMELSGVEDTYQSLDELVDIIEKDCPNAKIMWQMNWTYEVGTSHAAFEEKYASNQSTMYKMIVDVAKNKIDKCDGIDGIIPTGTAIQNLRTSFIGNNLTQNGTDLTYGLGRYVAAVSFVRGLGYNIDKFDYTPFADMETYIPIVVEAVNNAMSNPYKVTASTYVEKPAHIPALDEKETEKAPNNNSNKTQTLLPQSNKVNNNETSKAKKNHSGSDAKAEEGESVIQKVFVDTAVGDYVRENGYGLVIMCVCLVVATAIVIGSILYKKKKK